MAKKTAISWCHHTFNPWWGCLKVSDECWNCYAETFSKRVGFAIWGPAATTGRRLFGAKHWAEPLQWDAAAAMAAARRRVFCASMADVFELHPQLPPERAKLWPLIETTPHLDWLLLTKRPELVLSMVPDAWRGGFPPHVWVGTSAGTQQAADARIPPLLGVPAAVRFISAEPLLGPLDLGDLAGIHWVIGGGESGGSADRRLVRSRVDTSADPFSGSEKWCPKPEALEWARSLRDQCVQAGVPFHWKQWGGPHHSSGGRILDGREWDAFPTPALALA